ncbi:MAG: hypothetical protein V4734_03810, partial [Terriglobus sp.]
IDFGKVFRLVFGTQEGFSQFCQKPPIRLKSGRNALRWAKQFPTRRQAYFACTSPNNSSKGE